MTQDIALRTRAVQTIVELVYVHNLPVQLTLAAGATPSGLRILTLKYQEADELLAEWLIARATEDNETGREDEQSTMP